MNFKEALDDLIKDMEKDIDGFNEIGDHSSTWAAAKVEGYIRQLKMLAKLSTSSPVTFPLEVPVSVLKAQQRQQTKSQQVEERLGNCMVMCFGGTSDSCFIELAVGMPENARTVITGEVYQLRKDIHGKLALFFDEESTKKLGQEKK